jgi:hypothetical protein
LCNIIFCERQYTLDRYSSNNHVLW